MTLDLAEQLVRECPDAIVGRYGSEWAAIFPTVSDAVRTAIEVAFTLGGALEIVHGDAYIEHEERARQLQSAKVDHLNDGRVYIV